MTRSRLVLPTYVAAEAFSLFGNSAIGIALPWLVLLRTGDPAATAAVAAVAAVMQVIGTVLVGPLVDRFGARRLAAMADVGSAASVMALAVTDAFGELTLPLMIALAAAGALFDLPGMTARGTLMPRVAERAGAAIDSVASIRQAVVGLSMLAGPALAGVLLGVLPPSQVLWVTAACSGLAALTTLLVRVPPVTEVGESIDTGFLSGWRTLRRTPVLLKLFLVATMSAAMTAPLMQVLLPAHFAGVGRPDLLGFTMSAIAVGVMSGAGAYSVLARFSRRTAWTGAVVATTLGLVLIATLNGFWIVGIGALILGVSSGIVNPIFGVVTMERVPPQQLARVMGLTSAASLVSGPLGLAVAGFLVADGSLSLLAWSIVGAWVLVGAVGAFGSSLRDLKAPTTDGGADESAASAVGEDATVADH